MWCFIFQKYFIFFYYPGWEFSLLICVMTSINISPLKGTQNIYNKLRECLTLTDVFILYKHNVFKSKWIWSSDNNLEKKNISNNLIFTNLLWSKKVIQVKLITLGTSFLMESIAYEGMREEPWISSLMLSAKQEICWYHFFTSLVWRGWGSNPFPRRKYLVPST